MQMNKKVAIIYELLYAAPQKDPNAMQNRTTMVKTSPWRSKSYRMSNANNTPVKQQSIFANN